MEQEKRLHKILLVDDDLVSNKLAKRIIEKAGVTENVSIVTDGQKALEYILNPKKTLPELVFLDISMPVMDGFEFLKQFSKMETPTKEEMKIIILSALYNEDEVKDIADYDEVIGYMQKPLDDEKLKKAITYYRKKTAEV